MRKNRKDNTKKERIIMIASSAFVLTALTMTGVYMQSRDQELKDDGYTIDFTALEDNAGDKYQEIAQNDLLNDGNNFLEGQLNNADGLDDDLDYMPLEAGSSLIEIPGLTDRGTLDEADVAEEDYTQALSVEAPEAPIETEDPQNEDQPENTASAEESASVEGPTEEGTAVVQELHFSESEGLLRPVVGETVLPFSMDTSVYFTTLDQYKRNDAMMITAAEGATVTACAEGKVIDIFNDAVIGHAVTMELGDGYRITYGQLRDIQVALGSYVNSGDIIASVAAPTKYYVREGCNLYLKLTANNTPVDPEPLFR